MRTTESQGALSLAGLAAGATLLSGCAHAPLTQSQMDALQVRLVEAPPDRAFAAAASALLDAGYLVHVSDGEAGVLTGEKRVDPAVATNVAVILATAFLSVGHNATNVAPSYHAVSIQVLPGTDGRASVRIRPFLNGRPAPCANPGAVGRKTIDELWALVQRQVLMKEPARPDAAAPKTPP